MSSRTLMPAGRAPLALLLTALALPRPARAFWYSRSCVPDPGTATVTCTGLSWSAGAGIGILLLLLVLSLIFLVAWVNRPRSAAGGTGDIEEVWVAPPGVFAVSPLPGQVHVLPQGAVQQMSQLPGLGFVPAAAVPAAGGGVYPWMPSTYRSYPQQPNGAQANNGNNGNNGVPLAPPPPQEGAYNPFPSPIPEQTPKTALMQDVPLDSARDGRSHYPSYPAYGGYPFDDRGAGADEKRGLYDSNSNPGPAPVVGTQDVWRTPGSGRIVVRDQQDRERERERGLR